MQKKQTVTSNQARADLARAELAAFVRHYRDHNDAFERQMIERHGRWEKRGLLLGALLALAGCGGADFSTVEAAATCPELERNTSTPSYTELPCSLVTAAPLTRLVGCGDNEASPSPQNATPADDGQGASSFELAAGGCYQIVFCGEAPEPATVEACP